MMVTGVGGAAVYLTGGLATPWVAPMFGFGAAGVGAGTAAAAAQSYVGNVAAGSIFSMMQAAAAAAPLP